ncbi:MAG TPA: GNAT family N-acetyltransferase [Actinophytocola sp.]|uniref:GNAT family N-acetyltransferase n=1 Tax=Actinophytocola sp. TaxID=1872138 RepID=UPI002DBF7B77|nr:GNAT family N-acetyltransferase [Actinophytocola sp.]HEU5471313.1 GNAT family N-acetyltransferase [Actinophytocola sp.]
MVGQLAEYAPAPDRLAARPVTPAEVAAVARLAATADEFNLTGLTFDEGATTAMTGDPGHLVAAFGLDGGETVGAAWIERRGRVWWVLNLVLGRSAFGHGVEFAIADWIVRRARDAGAVALAGRYVPTLSNAAAAGFWERAGFTPSGEDGVFTWNI